MTGKKYAFLMVALAVALAASGCGKSNDTTETPSTAEQVSGEAEIVSDEDITPVDIGSMDDKQKYINETLGFEIQLPANWYYLSVEEMDENAQYQAQQDPSLAETLPYTTNLVYGIDQANDQGNFLQITTETIRDIKEPKEVIEQAKKSFDDIKEQLTANGITNIEVSEVEEETIDNHTYYSVSTIAPSQLQTTTNAETVPTTTSKMYITKLDDHTFLKLIFNYADASGEEAVNSAFSSIKHTK